MFEPTYQTPVDLKAKPVDHEISELLHRDMERDEDEDLMWLLV